MAEYEIIPKATLDAIEESIQRKRGETAPISPSQMPLAIDTIPSSADGTDAPVGGIYFTKPDSNGNPTECYIIRYSPRASFAWGSLLSFNYFPNLKKIEFINCSNIMFFSTGAFQNCTNLETINVPSGILKIATSAFVNCSSLTSVILPNTVTAIENAVFTNCSSLNSINFPNSLSSILDTFINCSALENVTIENGFNCNNLYLGSSTKYTTETIVSWLEALADRTGQTSFTLRMGSTNLNKLTAEQKAIATNKNWTLA